MSGEASHTCSCSDRVEAHLHKLAFFVELCLTVLGRELELEPQVVVTVLQVSEDLAGALADLFDRAAVQLAALLHAGPQETLHLGVIALRVHILAFQREDGFDRGGDRKSVV